MEVPEVSASGLLRNIAEGELALRSLKAPPLLLRAIKRAVVDHDYTLIRRSALRERSAVIAQSFVSGREATSAIACWQGKVMAALHFEVLSKGESSGPATVLRLIENAEMSTTAETIVRGLQSFRISRPRLHVWNQSREMRISLKLIRARPRSGI